MLHSLSELLRHEKDFTANASHQLRTPLTGLQLTLEAGLAQDDARLRPALEEALDATRRLHDTVEEVLRLAGSPGPPGAVVPDRSVVHLLAETDARWHGLFAQDGRRLDCGVQDIPADVLVPGGPVAEILGVLLDNARTHGRGSVRVTVRDLDDALAFDVADEGTVTVDPKDCSRADGPAGATAVRASVSPSPATWPCRSAADSSWRAATPRRSRCWSPSPLPPPPPGSQDVFRAPPARPSLMTVT
ncbi:HAMP domain-containing sensor histidine kinase [Streptomyces mirabilis]|nr:HAMP domain-containing sensor histidine kinase [Streptomyces mirabilis]